MKSGEEGDKATKTEFTNMPWDGIERRSGKDRRQFAYLQGRDRRYRG